MKDNKFLTGLLIVTLLGAGALGFFLFQAKGKYSEALDAYNTKIGELQTLQASKPFPDAENLKKMQGLQSAHQEVINGLQRELAAAEFPVKDLRPNEFQDKLKQTVDRVHQEAAAKGVELPKEKGNFALGFDRYLSEPPKPEVTPALGRMLEAVEKVTLLLIDTAPASIKDIKRTPLPGEIGAVAPAPAPAAKPGATGGKKGDAASQIPLVQRYPFELEFTASEFKVRTFINSLVAEKKQFYIPASVAIVNEQVAGPSKAQATAEGGAAAPAAPADPAAPASAPAATAAEAAPASNASAAADVPKFIVGEERLNVAMRIEVVDFAEPPAEKPAAEKSPAKKSSK